MYLISYGGKTVIHDGVGQPRLAGTMALDHTLDRLTRAERLARLRAQPVRALARRAEEFVRAQRPAR